MSALDRQIGRARRRLTANIFAQRLAFGVLLAAGLWTLVFLCERTFVLHIPVWHGLWVTALLAAAVVFVGTYLARVNTLQAAVAIDSAAGLKERLSTALAVRRDNDPFARLAVHDAEQTAGRVHVPTHLPFRAPSLWPWSVAGILVAVIFALFMPELNLLAGQDETASAEKGRDAEIEQRAINQDLEVRLNKIRQMTENNPALKDLAKDLEPLEMPDEPPSTPEDVRREAAQRIDNIADRLASKKNDTKLDALKQTKRMLSRMNPRQGQSPAAKLSQALAQGDFKSARKALREMQKELQESAAKGDRESRLRLAEMQKRLKRLSDQLAKLDDSIYLSKELQNKMGLSEEEAKKLLDKLSKMDPKQLEKELQRQMSQKGASEKQIKELVKKIQQQREAKKTCQNMGQCLAQAAQAVQQANKAGSGNSSAQAASAALADAMDQLSELEMSDQLLAELEAQMADLRDMRESVCQGNYGRCKPGGKIGPQGPNYGLGIGSRIGKERTAHSLKPTKVKSRTRGGTIIGQMLVDGPQMRGEATAEVREAVNAAQRDAQDAVEHDDVPRQYHAAVQQYFERLAGLVRQNQQNEPDDASESQNEDSESEG